MAAPELSAVYRAMQKSAASWETETVTKQLRCAGVMEAVRVIAAGYVPWLSPICSLVITPTRCA